MKRRESEFATAASKWLKYYWDPVKNPAYFEYKVTHKGALAFNAVSEKQYFNLQLKKFYYKFSDYDRLGTPFDSVFFSGCGYVVVQYYRPRNKEFFIIPIDIFIQERDSSKRKSLTEERAREIGMSCMLK